MKSFILAIGAALVAAACAAPPANTEEGLGASSSAIDGRYNPDTPQSVQNDDWSCSVYTTTWMLRATSNDQTWSSVSNRMLSTGRVSQAQGLSDASGGGLAQTLRDLATDSPSVGNSGSASFDDVAAKAGQMAVGIGGRAWNHWSGVRGYDAKSDVLLLANSAPGYHGVGQTLNRSQFANLGGMSMVWMDYGQVAPPPPPKPFEPSPRPASDPFPALELKSNGIEEGTLITQCSDAGDNERVWQTDGTGPDPSSRWAAPKYPEQPWQSCGAPSADGARPLVLRNLDADALGGTWIVMCNAEGDQTQGVYRVDGQVDGHASASFLYNESNPDCP